MSLEKEKAWEEWGMSNNSWNLSDETKEGFKAGFDSGVKAERERQKEIWDRLSTQAGNLHTFQERLLKELFPEMK